MKKNKNLFMILKFILFLIMVSVSLFIVIKNWHFIKRLKIDDIVHFVNRRRGYAAFIYLLIFAVKPFVVVIPSNIVSVGGGIIFGPVKGFILSVIGFWLSGTIAFFLSKFLGRDFVKSVVGDKFIKLDDNIENNGFKILLCLRLPPIIPYDPLSYACGFTNISYWDFIMASVIGILPETLCYSMLGKNFKHPFSWKFILPIVLVCLIAVFSKKIINLKNHEVNRD